MKGRIKDSRVFAAGESREIGRYEEDWFARFKERDDA